MSNPLIPNSPTLLIKEINDTYLRQNFKNLDTYFQTNNQLLGFKFFEVNLTKATTNYLVAHGLPFIPQDVIVSRVTGSGQVTFNYGLFDKSNVNITTTDACRIRFFVGTYFNFQSAAQPASSDAWIVNPVPAQASSTTSTTTVATNKTGQNIYTGAGAPSSSLGNIGDVYVNTTNGNYYVKSTVASWTNEISALSYAQAYFDTISQWITTSATFVDFTNVVAPTFTVRQHSGIALTAAASSLPGITFTPASASAVYLILAICALNYSGANGPQFSLQLTDGVTAIGGTAGVIGNGYGEPVPVWGVYVPLTTSPVTVKVQGRCNGGQYTLGGYLSGYGSSVEWTVLRIA